MKVVRITTLIAAVALSAATATLWAETKSDYDRDHDFSRLKTFDFKLPAEPVVKDTSGPNDLWNRRIHEDLTEALTASGFQLTTGGDPDFLVAYSMGAKRKTDVRSVGYGYPVWGFGRHRWAWGAWGPGFDVWDIPYTQSTLVVDIIDAHTNVLIWRGYDTDQIDVDKADKTIGKTVESLVKRFVKETREER